LNKSLHFVLILSLRLSWVFVLRGLREFCSSLQAVAAQVPLGGFLDGVGALEEFLAGLLLVSAAVGIQVFIQKFPHVVGERQDFQVFGVLESRFEFLGHVAVVFGFPHDFADQPLLAVEVVVVESFIEVLEHGDPLDDVQTVHFITIIGRSGIVVVVVAVSVGTVATIATAGLGFKIEVVEGNGGSADNGQEDKAIGQEGGVHCYQARGEVDKEQPGVGFSFGQIEVVGTSVGHHG